MDNRQEQRAWFDKEKQTVVPFFNGAHKVEAYRFIRHAEKKWHKPKGDIHGINYLASVTFQGAELATRLGTMVLDSTIYKKFGLGYSGCHFEPTFGYRIWIKDDFITIIFCMSCQELVILQNTPDLPECAFGSYVGRYNLAGHFDPDAKTKFANIYYKIFPYIG